MVLRDYTIIFPISWDFIDHQIQAEVGVCKQSPEPTRPTGADHPAPPLAPTDGADAGERKANGAPMPVR